MRHNAEPEAVDILLEVERLDWLAEHVDDKNYSRSAAAAVLCGGYQRRSPALPGKECIRIQRQEGTIVSCLALPASTCVRCSPEEYVPGSLVGGHLLQQVSLARAVPGAGGCTP